MSDTLRLGNIIESTRHAERDAVHVAVAPVVASCNLAGGWRVALNESGEAYLEDKNPIGIVDPFLNVLVRKHEKFWLFLFPGSITSLRHDWTHPAFGEMVQLPNVEVPPGSRYLEDVAKRAGLTLQGLIDGANNYLDDGEYLSQGDRWEGFDVGDGFWDAFEEFTGRKVRESDRGHFFSCSC